MKRILSYLLFACMIISTANAAPKSSVTPQELNFYAVGDGKFIYENNIESITREELSDTSNPNPTYIMKNTNLNPGKYSVFITNLNFTGIKNENGEIIEKGFNIELDGLFTAKERAVVKITSMGFEMPHVNILYQNRSAEKFEESWGCLNAWADYLKMPIYQINSNKKYYNKPFEPVSFMVNEKTNVWISQFIDNYSAVPYLKPVNIIFDFEVVQGKVDFHIAALKHNGILKDRSHHDYNALDGSFIRDRQYKGIAPTLPKVTASLNYTITDKVKNNEFLPVIVKNQYYRAGNLTDRWVTNLNPQSDIWSKDICAESDMLSIRYYDPQKVNLYSPLLADSAKDPFWYFDVYHADNAAAKTDQELNDPKYIPNKKVSLKENNLYTACNLGNYGVRVNYKITINNKDKKTRFANFQLKTGSNNIVILYDEFGEPVNPYAICKGGSHDGKEDVVASVELLPNKKTSFSLDIILPANYNGGTGSGIFISDEPNTPIFYEDGYEFAKKGLPTDGENFIKWHDSELYTSKDLYSWQKVNLSKEAQEIFESNGECFDIVKTQNGYMAKWAAFDGAPSYFQQVLSFYDKVYFFDEDFNLINTKTFDDYPTSISFSNGIYYVNAKDNYFSYDGINFEKLSTINIPVSNKTISAAVTKYGNFFISTKNLPYTKIDYGDNFPKYIDVMDHLFYYTNGQKLYLSNNAVYFKEFDAGVDIETVDNILNEIVINNNIIIKIPNFEDDLIVKVNGEIPVFTSKPIKEKDIWMIPAGTIFDKTDVEISWKDAENAVISKLYNSISIKINEDMAIVNGKTKHLSSAPKIINGELFVPYDFFENYLDFKANFIEKDFVLEILS